MIKSISFTQQIGMKSGIQYLQHFFFHSQEQVDVMLFRVTGPVSLFLLESRELYFTSSNSTPFSVT